MRCLGFFLAGLTTFVNCYSIPLARYIQIIFLIAKIAGITVLIGLGIAALANGSSVRL